jgi:putative ABC transport system permease protein
MWWIALKMLTGDTTKYFGMIFGIAFSTLLITQQSSIFVGLVGRSANLIRDVVDADIWVMDSRVPSVDNGYAMPNTALYRVKGVDGVLWAAPYLKATTTIISANKLQTAGLIGVDDASLVGLPPKMIIGSKEDLKASGTILMDEGGWKFLYKNEAFEFGRELELNDNRAKIVGLIDAGAQFTTQVNIFSRYSNALNYAPGGRNRMSFVIAKAVDGVSPEEVAKRITKETGLKALSKAEFVDGTSRYVIGNTGIPISFGVVVALGIVVGIVIVALTFTLFIRDNIKNFGALKAIGVSNFQLISMVALQGLLVGVIGYLLGIGMAVMIIKGGAENALALRGFYVPWQVPILSAGIVCIIIMIAGSLALRRVLTTDPASVFR